MNDTITLSQLITRLAKATGVDNNTARRFLRSFFATIEEDLVDGKAVSIKGIGTFRRSDPNELGNYSPVSFVPDETLAAELNRPFEAFEPVELADDVDFGPELVAEPIIESEPIPEAAPIPEPEPQYEAAPVVEPKPEPEPEPTQEPAPVPEPAPQYIPFPEEEAEEETLRQDNEEEKHFYDKPQRARTPMWVWFAIIIVIGCLAGYFAATYTTPIPEWPDEEEEETETPTPETPAIEEVSIDELGKAPAEASATIEDVTELPTVETPKETATKKEPVYDTVEISLIRLARKHYGVSEYWVYIFDANRDVIKNPNTIRPGTRVLIPDPSTIPGSTPEEAKALAKKKQSEYQSRF